MKVIDLLNNNNSKTAFSFETLPPLKGNSIQKIYNIIDKLIEFDPKYINITTHHSENMYKNMSDGTIQKVNVRKRPGTVAVAAAIQNKYSITAVPHVICNGFSKEETEYALIDLNFLGIHNLLLLRGDLNKLEPDQIPLHKNDHATDLQKQVNDFNNGIAADKTSFDQIETPFSYGMACYPEKHEEAPNFESDLHYLKMKQDLGADYVVTQMFFDNSKFFSFVEKCRAEGITIPIIPGIKPIGSKKHLTVLPRVFRSDLPVELANELASCKTDQDAKEIGVEWGIKQCKELIKFGVPSIHFYSLMATESVRRIAKEVY